MNEPEHAGVVVGAVGVIAEVEWVDEPVVLNTLLTVENDPERVMVVFSSATPSSVYCMVLTPQTTISRGMKVYDTGKPLSIPVGEAVLGRAMNVFGQELDGQGAIPRDTMRPVIQEVSTTLRDYRGGTEVLETGIKPIDFFTPLLQGGKAALVGGAGIGKTVILTEMINRLVIHPSTGSGQSGLEQGRSAVFSAVGERSREALELYEDLKDAKVLDRISLIIGQMGENPAIRWHTAYGSATIAEYLRDDLGHEVYFFMDNMYRFAQAGNEMSTLMNTIPSEDGYQPTLASEMAMLNQRLTSSVKGGITSFMALFVPSDDVTDAAVRSVFPYLDTVIVLSRKVFQQGRFPAMSLLESSSSALEPDIVGQEHYEAYVDAKQLLEGAAALERIVSLVGESELSQANQAVFTRAQRLYNFMTQDLFLQQRGLVQGESYIPREETVATVKAIIAGEYDEVDPDDFLFIGSIQNLRRKQAARASG